MYFIIDKADGYIERSNENKYLSLVSNDQDKEVLITYTESRNKTKNLIEKINSERGEYEKFYENSEDNLPLSEILSLHNIKIVVRDVFKEDKEYYLQVF